jgi:hypothetical protein
MGAPTRAEQPLAHQDQILDDIFSNQRSFLPGQARNRAETASIMGSPVLIGGLTSEESDLMLSALPLGFNQLWADPLDKGLSGSKVFSVRFGKLGESRRSKPFVMKVGPLKKIERERRATEELAAFLIPGIDNPVYRAGSHQGMIAQEYRGLREDSNLDSLRNVVRSSNRGYEYVTMTLEQRLAPWYSPEQPDYSEFTPEELFSIYRMKGPSGGGSEFPPAWSDLYEWVEDATGCAWGAREDALSAARHFSFRSRRTIVHGDLHSQNLLIDTTTGECWPIDFAWTRDNSSPVVDLVMLECSLKFLALPMRSDLRSLLPLEFLLSREPLPDMVVTRIPYSDEINNVMRAVRSVREFALHGCELSFEAYRSCLLVMTYLLATHPGLNIPYLLSSLQILSTAL